MATVRFPQVQRLRRLVDLPSCQATLAREAQRYRRDIQKREDYKQCGHTASFKIGKHYYCGKHAGVEALNILESLK